jgi:predicted XRE-type DNA-binding protein
MAHKANPKLTTERRVKRSSGNVFADLGFADAELALLKSRLAQHISQLVRSRGYTQHEAARQMGIDQPKVSLIMAGKLKDFSTDRLMTCITRLKQNVIVRFEETEGSSHANGRVLVEA